MRAQTSTEFITMFMVLLAALVIISIVSYSQINAVGRYQFDVEVEKILSEIELKINTAFLEGDGFIINMTLPDRIFSRDYSVGIGGNEVILSVEGITYTKKVLTKDITGVPQKGLNTIRNEAGMIIIQKP